MNRQSCLIIAFFFSLLFISVSTTYLDVKQIVPLPLAVTKKIGENKIIVNVSWTSTGEILAAKAKGRLRCHPHDAVTVLNGLQDHVVGDNHTSYEVEVHKKDALVSCRTGIQDGVIFTWKFFFKT
ncbi:12351_t:CDS:2 [Dentiscutata heterogama]|uniref:12351_t:CDS:1 n=1 Tax=Dentiscutata heterogama TaxID=1316150 RepID=A0ACA9K9Z6_9GLOM|nr:12351_t:CDS:2 [Dentiscutata heterogama]